MKVRLVRESKSSQKKEEGVGEENRRFIGEQLSEDSTRRKGREGAEKKEKTGEELKLSKRGGVNSS